MKALWIGGPESRVVKNLFKELANHGVDVDAQWMRLGDKNHFPSWVDVVICNEEACDRRDKDEVRKMAAAVQVPFVWGSIKGSVVVERLREKGILQSPVPATTMLPPNDREEYNKPTTTLHADGTLSVDGKKLKPIIVEDDLYVDAVNATRSKGRDVWQIARTRLASRGEVLARMPDVTIPDKDKIAAVENLVATTPLVVNPPPASPTEKKPTIVSYGEGLPALIDVNGKRMRPVKLSNGQLATFDDLATMHPNAEWVESPLKVHAIIINSDDQVELRVSVDGHVRRVKPLFVDGVYYDTQSEAAESVGVQQRELSLIFRKGEGDLGNHHVRAATLEDVRQMYPKAPVTDVDDESPEAATVVNVILADQQPLRVRTLANPQPQIPVIVDGRVFANTDLAARDFPLVRDAVRYLRSGKKSYNGHNLAWPTLDELRRTWPGAHVVGSENTRPVALPQLPPARTTKVFKAQVLPTGQVLVVPLSPKAQLFDSRDEMPPGMDELCQWD